MYLSYCEEWEQIQNFQNVTVLHNLGIDALLQLL